MHLGDVENRAILIFNGDKKMKIIIGITVGMLLGGLMGHFGKCSTGACPLTSTPVRGALYGALLGLMFSSIQ